MSSINDDFTCCLSSACDLAHWNTQLSKQAWMSSLSSIGCSSYIRGLQSTTLYFLPFTWLQVRRRAHLEALLRQLEQRALQSQLVPDLLPFHFNYYILISLDSASASISLTINNFCFQRKRLDYMEEYDHLIKKIDLGPMWEEDELDIFLQYFRKSGLKEVERMQEDLRSLGYNRSVANLISIYKKNKNFLSSNQNCTGHDLFLILSDHYEINENQQKDYNRKQSNVKKRKLNPAPHSYISQEKKPVSCHFPQSEEFIETICQAQCSGKSEIMLSNQLLGNKVACGHLSLSIAGGCSTNYTYFKLNEFQQLIQKAGIQGTTFTLRQWRQIKSAIGKPRRFSQHFIFQETQKLNKYRSIVRNFLFDNNYPIHKEIKNPELIQNLIKLASFNISQTVTAIHPICGHLHQGTILSTNLPNIIVRFQQPELGVHKIIDYNIQLYPNLPYSSPLSEERFNQNPDQRYDFSQIGYIAGHNTIFQNGMEGKNSQLQQLVQDVDCWSMAFLIKILQKQRKYELIQNLQKMNKEILMNKDQLREDFLNQYGWTGVQINIFDEAQKHALTKFRLRGLGGYCKEEMNQVNEHLDKILSVPLAYMERELEQNQDANNEETLQELKSIINKMQDEKIFRDLQLVLNQSLNKESMSEEDEEENGEEEEEQEKEAKKELNDEQQSKLGITHPVEQFLPLITSLLGVLLTMNHSGDINLTSNQYIQNLGKEIYSSHKNQFCEINEAIIRILGNNK